MGDDDPKVRFRICVSVQGASSLENLRQSAEELKKRTLEDKRLEQLLKSAAQICGLVCDDGNRSVTATILSGLRRGSHG
jgi:hypothetical protein